jgi:hypothetical protein
MGLLIKLQNGDTALKSLKFGKDRPGGGDSGQPYIKDPLLDNPLPESKDFLLRGGLNAPIDAAEDVVRLTKYMIDLKSPSGLLFIAKQNLLSRVAPKTEASKGAGYAGGAINGGVYTPLSTLAQAGVGFLGIHLNKQGIDPTGLIPGLSINKYEKVVYDNNKEENNIILGYSSKGTIANAVFENRLLDIWYSKQQKTTESNDVLLYGGGPNSILGIGKTHIEFAKDGEGAPLRTGINNSLAKTNPKYFYNGGLIRPIEINYNNLLGASKKQGLTEEEVGINSNGDLLPPQPSTKNQTQESDSTYSSQIEGKLQEYGRELLSDSTFLIGNTWRATSSGPSGIIQEYSSRNSLIVNKEASAEKNDRKKFEIINRPETEGYLANLDKNSGVAFINGTYTRWNNITTEGYGRGIARDFRRVTRKKRGFEDVNNPYDIVSNDKANWSQTVDKIYYDSSNKRSSNSIDGTFTDLITFKIEILDPRSPQVNPTTLQFRAYIDTFTDSYSSDWKPQTYMGRAEKFYKYDAFDRSISLGFTIVADSAANLQTMYTQLNTLAASLAPTYTTYGYMAGNLHKLTVGNYVSGQVGIMNGLTYDVIDESPWDIDKGLPHYIKVTGIKFTPIHNFRPESAFNNPHQYISQSNQPDTPTNQPTQ